MKKEVSVVQTICDFCNKETCYVHCLGCGKDICWHCQQQNGISFRHSHIFTGSEDGWYCHPCYASKSASPDSLFTNFRDLTLLMEKHEEWAIDFKHEFAAAEKLLAETPRPIFK